MMVKVRARLVGLGLLLLPPCHARAQYLSDTPTATPANSSRVEIELTGVGAYTDYSLKNTYSISGAGGVALTLYPHRPLVDTKDPLTLQPLLQRLTSLTLRVHGGGYEFNQGIGDVFLFKQVSASFSSYASFSAYIKPYLIVSGNLGFRRSRYSNSNLGPESMIETSYYAIPASLSVSLRFKESFITLGVDAIFLKSAEVWRDQPTYVWFSFRRIFSRQVHLSLYFSSAASDYAQNGGGFIGFYLERQLGIYFATNVTLRKFDESDLRILTLHGAIGFSNWLSRHFGTALTYNPSWSAAPNDNYSSTTSHTFQLDLISRFK